MTSLNYVLSKTQLLSMFISVLWRQIVNYYLWLFMCAMNSVVTVNYGNYNNHCSYYYNVNQFVDMTLELFHEPNTTGNVMSVDGNELT